jgi:uncharacterized membrane protein
VGEQGEQEHGAHQPQDLAAGEKRRPHGAQALGVGVEMLGSLKHFEVAEQVADHEHEQDHARHRHHGLLADERAGKAGGGERSGWGGGDAGRAGHGSVS